MNSDAADRTIADFWAGLRRHLASDAKRTGDELAPSFRPDKEKTDARQKAAFLNELLDGEVYLPLKDGTLRFLETYDALVQIEEILLHGHYDFRTDLTQPFVIDGGANFGLATYQIKRRHPDAEIWAYEPNPAAADVLRENAERLGWTGVKIEEAALGGERGEVPFNVHPGMPMGSSRFPRLRDKGFDTEAITVPQHAVTDIVADRIVAFLKLDVEGNEYEIFDVLDGKLRNVQNIFIEVHFGGGISSDHLSRPLSVLERNDFEYMVARADGVTPLQPLMGKNGVRGKDSSVNVWARQRTLK
ncbi:FkbM family methyltransferase [Roseovarius indicus]|uniref:FkbM family methyltransferase n=1 Tax=Roseovarius indicus TaxID=540747 RepID=UPI0032ED4301